MHDTETYRVGSDGWVNPLLVGISVYAIHLIFQWHVFYLHFYFFFASVINIALSYIKYASLDDKALVIFYGLPFFRNKISLKWEQIVSVEMHFIKKAHFLAARIVSLPIKYSQEALLIRLNVESRSDTFKLLKTHSGNKIFGSRFIFNCEGDGVILSKAPLGGFRSLMKSASRYTHVDNYNTKIELNKIENLVVEICIKFALISVVVFPLWLINVIIS